MGIRRRRSRWRSEARANSSGEASSALTIRPPSTGCRRSRACAGAPAAVHFRAVGERLREDHRVARAARHRLPYRDVFRLVAERVGVVALVAARDHREAAVLDPLIGQREDHLDQGREEPPIVGAELAGGRHRRVAQVEGGAVAGLVAQDGVVVVEPGAGADGRLDQRDHRLQVDQPLERLAQLLDVVDAHVAAPGHLPLQAHRRGHVLVREALRAVDGGVQGGDVLRVSALRTTRYPLRSKT